MVKSIDESGLCMLHILNRGQISKSTQSNVNHSLFYIIVGQTVQFYIHMPNYISYLTDIGLHD